MVLEALDRAVRQENEIKELQIGDMILYIRDSKNSTGKLLERISDSSGQIQSKNFALFYKGMNFIQEGRAVSPFSKGFTF